MQSRWLGCYVCKRVWLFLVCTPHRDWFRTGDIWHRFPLSWSAFIFWQSSVGHGKCSLLTICSIHLSYFFLHVDFISGRCNFYHWIRKNVQVFFSDSQVEGIGVFLRRHFNRANRVAYHWHACGMLWILRIIWVLSHPTHSTYISHTSHTHTHTHTRTQRTDTTCSSLLKTCSINWSCAQSTRSQASMSQ